ncbi:MAG TPA: hypothetical protein VFN87_05105 [Solirubrobacteraceae bacterium]|nr:hypothetical protein [Solirubrobacteraceae bacterium]
MAKNDKTATKKGNAKTKGNKKPKGKKGTAAGEGISIAGHPRAAAQVRRAKGLGGIGFFAIAAYLSFKAGVPADQVALRAVAVGIAGYMLAWACSVTVWRHLVLAELRAAVESGRATFDRTSPPAARPPSAEPGAAVEPVPAED